MTHLVMIIRNILKRPSSIDDVRLGNAFSSKESPKTLSTLNIDQALACVLKTVFSFWKWQFLKLCLPQLVTATAICIVGGRGKGGGGSSQQVGVCNANKTIIVRNAHLIATLTHWNLKWPLDIYASSHGLICSWIADGYVVCLQNTVPLSGSAPTFLSVSAQA